MSEGDPAKSRPPVSSSGGVREAEASAVTEGAFGTVPEAHKLLNTQPLLKLQVDILKEDVDIDAFVATISGARFNKFLRTCQNDRRAAIFYTMLMLKYHSVYTYPFKFGRLRFATV